MDQIYKVLIIDDEVDSFCNDEKVIKCRQERVELIKAHNISEFEAYLRNCDGYVDALWLTCKVPCLSYPKIL